MRTETLQAADEKSVGFPKMRLRRRRSLQAASQCVRRLAIAAHIGVGHSQIEMHERVVRLLFQFDLQLFGVN
jgi:hypothetical protein